MIKTNYTANAVAAMRMRKQTNSIYWQSHYARTHHKILVDLETYELYSAQDSEELAAHFGDNVPYFTYADPVELLEELQEELEVADEESRAVVQERIDHLKHIARDEIARHIARKLRG